MEFLNVIKCHCNSCNVFLKKVAISMKLKMNKVAHNETINFGKNQFWEWNSCLNGNIDFVAHNETINFGKIKKY